VGEEPSIGQFTLFIVEVADVTYIGSESGTGARPGVHPAASSPRPAWGLHRQYQGC